MASKTQRKLPDKAEIELQNLHSNRTFRFRELLGEKWPADDIEALVNGEHHPSKLEKMLKDGCPPRLALKILI